MKTTGIWSIVLLIVFFGCSEAPKEATAQQEQKEDNPILTQPAKPLPAGFKEYWYKGNAEVTSYELQQARYGQLRDGHAVLIYVTEPFSTTKQVKPDRTTSEDVSVLKLNRTKKFLTGLYPYSMMSSIFYPVGDNSHAIKISCSVQEWCGHIYTQLNNREAFEINGYSYFESEGDQQLRLDKNPLEDQVWNQIRIRPENLVQGEILMIPSFEFLRLRHQPVQAYNAIATLMEAEDGSRVYRIEYPDLTRTLEIQFTKNFPHQILGWTETYPGGFGSEGRILETKATLKKQLKIPYWQKNSNADRILRDSLGLE